MKTTPLLLALSVLCPTLAWSNPVHNVWSVKGTYVSEPGASYTPVSTQISVSWKEGSASAFINAVAKAPTGAVYEFQLVSVSGSPTADEVQGVWNVTKNGAPLCSMCLGHAYGLTSGIGSYFKIYISGESFHVGGYVANRFDY
jgi:hypothetical protein